MVDWILTRAVYAVLFALISTLAVNSLSQNSIHPRNTSTENAHGGIEIFTYYTFSKEFKRIFIGLLFQGVIFGRHLAKYFRCMRHMLC